MASANERWSTLQNSFGGLFCSSLSATSDAYLPSSSSPTLTFTPMGPLPLTSLSNSSSNTDSQPPYHLRRRTWPSERLCTENLTPFLKLLPCKRRAGLAQLLDPHKLVGADWHGMGVHTTWVQDGERRGVELELMVRAVFDPVRMSFGSLRGSHYPHMSRSCELIIHTDWSLVSVFGVEVGKACAAAERSEIKVHLPSANGDVYSINPEPARVERGQQGESIGVYELAQGSVFCHSPVDPGD